MIHRAILALFACLVALAAPASARCTAFRVPVVPPPMALFGVELSNEQDCGPLTLHLDGLHDRAGPCRRVLVRQNPWSAFDPYGLWQVIDEPLPSGRSGLGGYLGSYANSPRFDGIPILVPNAPTIMLGDPTRGASKGPQKAAPNYSSGGETEGGTVVKARGVRFPRKSAN